MVYGLGLGLQGSGFRVQGSGFRAWGLEFGVWDLGFEVWDLEFEVSGFGIGDWGLVGDSGLGIRVGAQGLRSWV